jgi:hypothetical protein
MNPARTTFLAVLVLLANRTILDAQSLDNYPPRGRNPDAYNTNADGSFPRTGGAKPATSVKARENTKKNRWDLPAAAAFDSHVTLAAMLARGSDRNRFTEGHAARVTGYVAECKTGGSEHREPPHHSGESCNNGATNALDTDTHIDLVLTSSEEDVGTRHVIVEITPRLRELMRRRRINWTPSAVRSQIWHRWVEFEGWLFFDPDHINEAANTDPQDNHGRANWRATCWEIHPVTKFRVLQHAPEHVVRQRPARRQNRN